MALPPYELKNGDGSTTVFAFSFPYLESTHVKVYVSGVDTSFSFATSQSIEISPAPASSTANILIRRVTDTAPSVDFVDGSTLNEADLDYAFLQSLYVAEEANYIADNLTMTTTPTGEWDGASIRLTALSDPTQNQDAVTKSYGDVNYGATAAAAALASETAAGVSEAAAAVSETNAAASETNAANSAASAQASAAGIYWKAPVLVSSTANLTLSGAQTIDGISAVAGSRVLVKDQTAPAENGIYIVAAGAWSRAVPMDTWDEHVGAVVLVSQGSLGENKAYQCTVNASGTLDTTAITWASFGAVAINFIVDTFVDVTDYTSGTTTALTLSAEAGSEQNITVTFDGVTQHHNQFSLSGTTLTFTEAIPLGVDSVEVKLGSSLGIGTPSDGTVTEAKIATSAVTEAKIATSAVTVTKIADDAITLAKMAGGTDGNLITYDASGDPAYVATGTVGQVLTSGGAGVAPTMQDAAGGGAWNLISSATASASSSIDFASGIDSTYDVYKLYIVALTPSNNATSLFMRVKQSGTSRSSGNDYRWRVSSAYYTNGYGAADQNNSDTEIELAFGIGGEGASNTAGNFIHYEITMYKPSDTTGKKNFNFVGYTANQSVRHMGLLGQGIFQGNNSAIDGLDFRMSAGTITVGGFYLYGLSKS